jgi:hypothetical protein
MLRAISTIRIFAVKQCDGGIDIMTLMKGVHGASWVRKEYSGALRAGT